jgi:ParB family chromosome partitioning protein
LRLLQLPPSIQRYLQDGSLRMGHARALLATPDRAFQEQLAKRAVAEDLSVRAVEEAVRSRNGEPERAAGSTTQRSAGRMRPPGLLELEELLGDYLETRVHVTMGPKLGRVVIDFATLEDLERIYRVMTEGSRRRENA